MKNILETERLILRELEISDAQYMYDLNLDFEVIKYTGDSSFESLQVAEQFLKDYDAYQKNGFGRWAVIEKLSNEFIGWCGLKRNEEGFVDIGFRFYKKKWNQGFATEAAKACLDFGFEKLDLEEIIGRAESENRASIRVLEKIGMQFIRRQKLQDFEDAVIYITFKPKF